MYIFPYNPVIQEYTQRYYIYILWAFLSLYENWVQKSEFLIIFIKLVLGYASKRGASDSETDFSVLSNPEGIHNVSC